MLLGSLPFQSNLSYETFLRTHSTQAMEHFLEAHFIICKDAKFYHYHARKYWQNTALSQPKSTLWKHATEGRLYSLERSVLRLNLFQSASQGKITKLPENASTMPVEDNPAFSAKNFQHQKHIILKTLASLFSGNINTWSASTGNTASITRKTEKSF